MIDLSKKYRTRDGREVTLFTTEAKGQDPVVGQITGSTLIVTWDLDGSVNTGCIDSSDLIEINPEEELLEEAKRRYLEGRDGQWAEIVKTHKVKVYLYKHNDGALWVHQDALFPGPIACKQIEFFEGEGIESPNQK